MLYEKKELLYKRSRLTKLIKFRGFVESRFEKLLFFEDSMAAFFGGGGREYKQEK